MRMVGALRTESWHTRRPSLLPEGAAYFDVDKMEEGTLVRNANPPPDSPIPASPSLLISPVRLFLQVLWQRLPTWVIGCATK